MKLYKKLIAAFMCTAMLITLSFGTVSAEQASARTPDVPEGYDGFVIVDFEAFVLGLGYIVEPTYVPYHNGESVADVTIRCLENAGINGVYSYSEYGFGLTGVECPQLAAGAEIAVPNYLAAELESNFGCYNEEGDDWYTPENGDGILSQQEYTFYSGWMYIDNNVDMGVGASGLTVEDGHVYRWMYSIYGYGMDIGISDGWGMFPAFDNPSIGVSRDDASTLYAYVISDPELLAMVEEGGPAYDLFATFVDTLSDLSSTQAEIDEATTMLLHALVSTVTPGDVNGDGIVSVSDAISILRHVMGIQLLEGNALVAADVNTDGSVNSPDAILALRIALELTAS